MQRRISTGMLIVIAAVTLLVGTIGGGIIGGTAGYLLTNDDEPSVETTVPDTSSDPTTISNPESTAASEERAQETAQDSSDEESEGIPEVFDHTSEIAEQVSPAVVTVINEQQFAGGIFGGSNEAQPAGSGTGFIISEDGYIVTNNHVVEGSDNLLVIFADGSQQQAQLIGTDPLTDLAVLKIDGEVPATVTLGDSDQLEPGDWVIAIGSALGEFTNTVTQGVVSGLHRELGNGSATDMVQHDAAINPGNSGGPLVNMAGEVVGVNTLVLRDAGGVTAEGLGFAIPSNTVKQIVDTLIAEGKVTRPLLGITYRALTPRFSAASNLPIDHGALVAEVTPNGPAAQAGIQPEDVITKIDGQEITADRSLQEILFEYQPGDTVEVELYRPSTDETLTVSVTLDERPADLQ